MNNHIELTKFCSTVNKFIGYQHFVWWNPPTNYVNNSDKEGEITDIDYAVFGVGCYEKCIIKEELFSRNMKRDRAVYYDLYFGPITKILNFKIFNHLFDEPDARISNFDDFLIYTDDIKERIEDLVFNHIR
jgi:hypothetical protein